MPAEEKDQWAASSQQFKIQPEAHSVETFTSPQEEVEAPASTDSPISVLIHNVAQEPHVGRTVATFTEEYARGLAQYRIYVLASLFIALIAAGLSVRIHGAVSATKHRNVVTLYKAHSPEPTHYDICSAPHLRRLCTSTPPDIEDGTSLEPVARPLRDTHTALSRTSSRLEGCVMSNGADLSRQGYVLLLELESLADREDDISQAVFHARDQINILVRCRQDCLEVFEIGHRSAMDTIATLLAVLAQARNDTIAFRSHLQTNISVVKHTISVLLLQRRHQTWWWLHLFQSLKGQKAAAYLGDLGRLTAHLANLDAANSATAVVLENLSELRAELKVLQSWLTNKPSSWQLLPFAELIDRGALQLRTLE